MTIDTDTTESSKLETKIILMSLINIISFIVTLKQLCVDTSWNMKVRVRDPDVILSCSSFESNSRCCKKNIKASVSKMYDNNQVTERHVLCFIIVGGMSAFAVLFIIGGFCVGCRSKQRNVLMHPIFSVGTFAHLTNCFFFALGLFLRHSEESGICSTALQTSQSSSDEKIAIKCLRKVLPCQEMDLNFKYWFMFSVGWVLVGFLLLLFSYQYSKPYYSSFCQMFSCSRNIVNTNISSISKNVSSSSHHRDRHWRGSHRRNHMTVICPLSSSEEDGFTVGTH